MLERLISPSTRQFLINSGFVTGLSLASLAGVALLHLETDRGRAADEIFGQTECRSPGQQKMFDCDRELNPNRESVAPQTVLAGSSIRREMEAGDEGFSLTAPQGARLPAAVSVSGSK